MPVEKVVPDLNAAGQDLFKRMFAYDPAERISARAALQHPYFDGVATDDGGA